MDNQVKTITTDNIKFKCARFGNFDLLIVNDGEVQYDNSCFAPGVLRAELQQIRTMNNIVSPHFKLPHNILIIIEGDKVVMVDTGNGSKAGDNAGKLVTNLRAAGIELYELTDIVLSHAHPDHINGLLDDEGELIFPNAKIHIHQKEFDFWQNENADFSKSKSSLSSLLAVQLDIKFILNALHGKLQLFTDTLFDFLQPIFTPGHTPGHCMFAITLGEEKFIHMADIFHDEIVLFERPGWGTVFDIDFYLAANTRQTLLKEYAQCGQKVFGYHLPWPGLGYIGNVDKTYRWLPQ